MFSFESSSGQYSSTWYSRQTGSRICIISIKINANHWNNILSKAPMYTCGIMSQCPMFFHQLKSKQMDTWGLLTEGDTSVGMPILTFC